MPHVLGASFCVDLLQQRSKEVGALGSTILLCFNSVYV